MSLHDSLHVSTPSVLSGDENTGRVFQSLSELDLLNLVGKDLLDKLAKTLISSLLFFEALLLLLGLVELKSLLGAVLKLLSVELLELLDDVLIDWVNHVKDLIASLLELLNEGRLINLGLALSSDEEDVVLTFLHSGDVVLERDLLISGFTGVVSQVLSQLLSVGGVLVDSQLEVL